MNTPLLTARATTLLAMSRIETSTEVAMATHILTALYALIREHGDVTLTEDAETMIDRYISDSVGFRKEALETRDIVDNQTFGDEQGLVSMLFRNVFRDYHRVIENKAVANVKEVEAKLASFNR